VPPVSTLAVQMIEQMPPDGWAAAAHAAGVGIPSETTKAATVEAYRKRAAVVVPIRSASRESAEYAAEVYRQKRDARVAKKGGLR
jgi:hypothetical protein